MRFHIETPRLVLRDMLPEDVDAMFELDSDPEVVRYIGIKPVTNKEEVAAMIEFVRRQYEENGIGRWVAVEKAGGQVIGWSGLKFITKPENNQNHFYDVGYRLLRKHWGKGYATESAKAALQYGFEVMKLNEIIGTVHAENVASQNVLKKCGLKYIEDFMHDDFKCHWMKITKQEWEKVHSEM